MLIRARFFAAAMVLPAIGLLCVCSAIGDEAWRFWGIYPLKPSFADLQVISAAWESRAAGHDPLVSNPFDPWNRALNYPRVWEVPGVFGARGHVWQMALIVWGVFFAGAYALMRTLERRFHIVLAGLLCSPSVFFLLERGNIDGLLFTMCIAAALFATGQPRVAATITSLGFVLKIYPIILIGAIDSKTSIGRKSTFYASAFCLIAGLSAMPDLAFIRAATPTTEFQSYGRLCVSSWIGRIHPGFVGPAETLQTIGVIVPVLLATFLGYKQRSVFATTDSTARLMVCGCLLYSFTFLLGSNFSYRATVLLLCVPWLLHRRSIMGYCFLVLIALALWQIKLEKTFWITDTAPDWVILVVHSTNWLLYVLTATIGIFGVAYQLSGWREALFDRSVKS